MLTPRKSTPEDAYRLSKNLREADLQEVQASGVDDPLVALMAGVASPYGAITGVDERGEPMMMFGVVPHPTEPLAGLIWALTAEGIKKHRRMFLAESRQWIEGFHRQYPVLTNHTDCRNTEHHRWLRWCGFKFINKVDGPRGFPFYEFVRIRSEQCATP